MRNGKTWMRPGTLSETYDISRRTVSYVIHWMRESGRFNTDIIKCGKATLVNPSAFERALAGYPGRGKAIA